eukprot:2626561-Pleurochrysis_carterae.AAC.2
MKNIRDSVMCRLLRTNSDNLPRSDAALMNPSDVPQLPSPRGTVSTPIRTVQYRASNKYRDTSVGRLVDSAPPPARASALARVGMCVRVRARALLRACVCACARAWACARVGVSRLDVVEEPSEKVCERRAVDR